MHVAMGLVVIAVTALALAPWRGANRWMVLLAGLPGYLLLASVANDHARWTLFACIALWLFAISAPRAALASSDRRVALADVACLAAAGVLVLALVPGTRPGISRVVSPVPRADQWLYGSSGPKPLGWTEVVGRCDPTWRDVLRASPSPQALAGVMSGLGFARDEPSDARSSGLKLCRMHQLRPNSPTTAV